jgi:hypothetical protein
MLAVLVKDTKDGLVEWEKVAAAAPTTVRDDGLTMFPLQCGGRPIGQYVNCKDQLRCVASKLNDLDHEECERGTGHYPRSLSPLLAFPVLYEVKLRGGFKAVIPTPCLVLRNIRVATASKATERITVVSINKNDEFGLAHGKVRASIASRRVVPRDWCVVVLFLSREAIRVGSAVASLTSCVVGLLGKSCKRKKEEDRSIRRG